MDQIKHLWTEDCQTKTKHAKFKLLWMCIVRSRLKNVNYLTEFDLRFHELNTFLWPILFVEQSIYFNMIEIKFANQIEHAISWNLESNCFISK